MTHRRIGQLIVAVAASLAGIATLQAFQAPTTRQLEAELQAGIRLETVNGDCPGAIKRYQRVAEGGDRALAARALLRTAGCYEKMADAQALQVYEQLIARFGDQAEAAEARTRVAGLTGSPAAAPAGSQARGDRTVWAGLDADGFGTISPDGRFLTFTDWRNGASLGLRDLALGRNYRLTTGGAAEFSAISRDGKQVAYRWVPEGSGSAQGRGLRVGTLTPTGMSDSRLVYASEEAGLTPFDWSPDGQWISVAIYRRDGSHQIGLVSVRDGTLRVLKSVDWKEPTKVFFSADGKYIAYDLEANDEGIDRHIFVLAVDGSSESPVVADASRNVVMGWSPDGQSVLFSSDRSGSVGLWAIKVAQGRAEGDATLLKDDIASAWSLGLTSSGAMYVWKYASPRYVQVSAVDLASGTVASTAPTFQRFISSRGRPAWSPDGRSLAFQSCNPLGAGPCTLWIQSMDTGELRKVSMPLSYFLFMKWSPDGRQVLTQGRNARGRDLGLYRIDVQTGAATPLPPGLPANTTQWGVDSQHVTFRRGSSVIERNLESGAERELVRIPTEGAGRSVMSPDGRTVAYLAQGKAGSQQLLTLSVSGGAPRSLFEVTAPHTMNPRLQWTADGRSIAVIKQHEEPALSEIWIVEVDGTKSRTLDVALDQWLLDSGVELDQAGRQIAFVAAAGRPGLEIRALENFLPAEKR